MDITQYIANYQHTKLVIPHPTLQKYNPILKLLPPCFILISLTLFMFLLLILSYCTHKTLKILV